MSATEIVGVSAVAGTFEGGIAAPSRIDMAGQLFESVLAQIDHLNGQLHETQESVRLLAAGEADNLHQVVLQMERTRVAFDVMLQVRNRALEAYQELMRMQV